MGLDIVAFALSVEEALLLRFPDADFGAITTPRRLIDFVTTLLPPAATHYCLSQRAFYRLRRAVVQRLGRPGLVLRPRSSLLAVIPAKERDAVWTLVRRDVGAGYTKYWPQLAKPGWFRGVHSPRLACLRDTARFLVARLPLLLKAPGEGKAIASLSSVNDRREP
jgi:hypothetical protein